ncbi:hypothetical protein EKK58_05330 [Candidatus Dependentiae bacterium]|nr:MAG: hypothetical protein EKK58_05330 [Candidatus Dependentiae bacterium]
MKTTGRVFSWFIAIGAMLMFTAFPLVVITTGTAGLIVGCSNAPNDGSGGATMTTSTGSSTSSSSSSSSGSTEPTCSGAQPIGPLYGELGGYYENGVLACRRFVPSTYPYLVDSFTAAFQVGSVGSTCSLTPDMVWAIGAPSQTTGFAWSTPVPATMGGIGTLTVGQTLSVGQAFFACLKLASLGEKERSCVMGCYFDGLNMNADFFWGDTMPPDGTINGGKVLDPPVLEPLAKSPTPDLAASVGNDKLGLVIDIFGTP